MTVWITRKHDTDVRPLSELPSIQTLLEYLQPQKTIRAWWQSVLTDRSWTSLPLKVSVGGSAIWIVAFGVSRVGPVTLIPVWQEIAAAGMLIALSAVSIAYVYIVVSTINDITRPARFLAKQLDEQIQAEERLIRRLLGIPADVLADTRERLELHIAAVNRRTTLLRVFAVFTPIAVAASRIDPKAAWLPAELLEIFVLFLAGVLVAVVALRSGTETLRRLSYVLKKATDRSRHVC